MDLRRTMMRILVVGGYTALIATAAVLFMEMVYRHQIIDTYRPELRGSNPDSVLNQTAARPTILVMGDSFTAGRYSYPELLRERFPRYRIINAAISGTGVVQAEIAADRRIEEFQPSILIYQVYVGNDLINIRYPKNWAVISPIRNIYGIAADRLRSVSFLNYRLGQVWYSWTQPTRTGLDDSSVPNPPFSPETYSPIQKRYLTAESHVLEDQIMVTNERAQDFDRFVSHLKDLVARCTERDCRAYVLVLPHASQVHPRYLDHMRALGAKFRDPDSLHRAEYPFLARTADALGEVGGAMVLNPLPVLQMQERAGQTLYYFNDGHLNSDGQAVVASFLEERLKQDLSATLPADSSLSP